MSRLPSTGRIVIPPSVHISARRQSSVTDEQKAPPPAARPLPIRSGPPPTTRRLGPLPTRKATGLPSRTLVPLPTLGAPLPAPGSTATLPTRSVPPPATRPLGALPTRSAPPPAARPLPSRSVPPPATRPLGPLPSRRAPPPATRTLGPLPAAPPDRLRVTKIVIPPPLARRPIAKPSAPDPLIPQIHFEFPPAQERGFFLASFRNNQEFFELSPKGVPISAVMKYVVRLQAYLGLNLALYLFEERKVQFNFAFYLTNTILREAYTLLARHADRHRSEKQSSERLLELCNELYVKLLQYPDLKPHLLDNYSQREFVEYLAGSVQTCWLMTVTNPPITLMEPKIGETFNPEKHNRSNDLEGDTISTVYLLGAEIVQQQVYHVACKAMVETVPKINFEFPTNPKGFFALVEKHPSIDELEISFVWLQSHIAGLWLDYLVNEQRCSPVPAYHLTNTILREAYDLLSTYVDRHRKETQSAKRLLELSDELYSTLLVQYIDLKSQLVAAFLEPRFIEYLVGCVKTCWSLTVSNPSVTLLEPKVGDTFNPEIHEYIRPSVLTTESITEVGLLGAIIIDQQPNRVLRKALVETMPQIHFEFPTNPSEAFALIKGLPSKILGQLNMSSNFPNIEAIDALVADLQNQIRDDLEEYVAEEQRRTYSFAYSFINLILREAYALLAEHADRHRDEEQSAGRLLELSNELYARLLRQHPDFSETLQTSFSDSRFIKYLVGCVQTCWVLTVNNPPITLWEPKIGETFDLNKHSLLIRISPGDIIVEVVALGAECSTIIRGQQAYRVDHRAKVIIGSLIPQIHFEFPEDGVGGFFEMTKGLPTAVEGYINLEFPNMEQMDQLFGSLQEELGGPLLEHLLDDDLKIPDDSAYFLVNTILRSAYNLLQPSAERHKKELQTPGRLLELANDLYALLLSPEGPLSSSLQTLLRASSTDILFVNYLVGCVKICWLLTVNNPPITLVDPRVGEIFDRKKHSRSVGTPSGNTIATVVLLGAECSAIIDEKQSYRVLHPALVKTASITPKINFEFPTNPSEFFALTKGLPSKKLGQDLSSNFPNIEAIDELVAELQASIGDNLLDYVVLELKGTESFAYSFANLILREAYALLAEHVDRHRKEEQSAGRLLELSNELYARLLHQHPDFSETLQISFSDPRFIQYLVGCVKTCWLLTVNNPAITLLEPKVGETFDPKKHSRLIQISPGDIIVEVVALGAECSAIIRGQQAYRVDHKAKVIIGSLIPITFEFADEKENPNRFFVLTKGLPSMDPGIFIGSSDFPTIETIKHSFILLQDQLGTNMSEFLEDRGVPHMETYELCNMILRKTYILLNTYTTRLRQESQTPDRMLEYTNAIYASLYKSPEVAQLQDVWHEKAVVEYLVGCVKMCWLFNAHAPQVTLIDPKPGDTIDRELHARSVSSEGTIINSVQIVGAECKGTIGGGIMGHRVLYKAVVST